MMIAISPATTLCSPMAMAGGVSQQTETKRNKNNDILIAVMGATGVGKSSFINTTAGSALAVGDDLESETKEVDFAKFTHRGHRITLIDTPGFDDTYISDTDILQTIAQWLEHAHTKGRRLNGLLYLHRITDNRVSGMSAKNMRLFHMLCGKDAMKNVVLCTTMWNVETAAKAESREKQLLSKFWHTMTEQGAKSARHDGTIESSLEIIDQLLGLPPISLDIQKSLAEGKSLSETAAGQEISRELIALQAKHKQEIEDLMNQMKEALKEQDIKAHSVLMAERMRLEGELSKKQREQEQLSSLFRENLERVENGMKSLKKQWDESWCVIA
ncbi:hypothetical protein FRC03_010551 [Tulasnella sp. 419]|nr:hypothetical protein FRC03_010551 [Tulasnella sp. 419]